MDTVQKTVTLPKAADGLATAVSNVGFDSVVALRDGFQPGADVGPLFASVMANFQASVTAIQGLPEALRVDPAGAAEAFVMAALEMARKIRALPPLPTA